MRHVVMLAANVGIKSASASAFGLELLETFSWPLSVQWQYAFLEVVIPRLLVDVLLIVRHSYGFSMMEHWCTGEDVLQCLNVTCPWRLIECWGQITWPYSPYLTAINCFLWGNLKEHIFAISPRTIKNLVPRLQAAETVVNASMLRHVRQKAAWHMAVCREMGGGHCDHLLWLQGTHTLIIW
jgi:hypothetical protein